MTKRANLKSTNRQGRPYKAMQWSFDESADKAFTIAGQILDEAEGLPLVERLKVLQVCLPLALKRIPDKVEQTSLVLNISDNDAQSMLAEARANLLIYKELRAEKISTSNAQDADNIPTITAQDVKE